MDKVCWHKLLALCKWNATTRRDRVQSWLLPHRNVALLLLISARHLTVVKRYTGFLTGMLSHGRPSRLPVRSGPASKKNPYSRGLAAHPSTSSRPCPQPRHVSICAMPWPPTRPTPWPAVSCSIPRELTTLRASGSGRVAATGPAAHGCLGHEQALENRRRDMSLLHSELHVSSPNSAPASSSTTTSVHSSKQQGDIVLKVHVASIYFKRFRCIIWML
jgi:hypothetical protein